jgi:HK97 gp10 family phage protein
MRISATASFKPASTLSLVSRIAAGALQGVTNAGQQALELEQSLTPVETGALRDSEQCVVTSDSTSASATVGPTMFYDEYVEYGTGRKGGPAPYPHVETWPGQHPEPYARPMMDEMSGKVSDIIADAIKEAL